MAKKTDENRVKSIDELLTEAKYCVDCAVNGWEVSGNVLDAIQILRLIQAKLYAEAKPNR